MKFCLSKEHNHLFAADNSEAFYVVLKGSQLYYVRTASQVDRKSLIFVYKVRKNTEKVSF